MNIVVIVQARMGSSRLPGKVLLWMEKGTALELLLLRLAKSRIASKIVVATSVLAQDNVIADFCDVQKIDVYRGDEQDVLQRYYEAAKLAKADIVVRVTADCPLFDVAIMDVMLQKFLDMKVDYLSNVFPIRSFPKGLDAEIFTFQALEKAARKAKLPREREHVTPYLQNTSLFKTENFLAESDLSQERWTLDYPEDYYFLRRVYHYLDSPTSNYQEITRMIRQTSELAMLSERLNKLYKGQ